uniref:Ferredoxin n=1 Tax=Dasya naccarioides TaxID=2007180 RepID=A0A1Z1MH05_9FLOR|nr:ferredoxin [Dasya naccarioides]ARW65246.1 ferredoxin [Dasya naccarioides]
MAIYEVTLILEDDSQAVVKCEDDTTILEASETDADLPYSCRAGSCSSCAGLLQDGEINQEDQTFLEDKDIAKGFILTCVAYPLSDCTIKTHQEDVMTDE